MQCAPLATEHYSNEVVVQNVTWVQYNYGLISQSYLTIEESNFTYEMEDWKTQYSYIGKAQTEIQSGFNYKLRQVDAHLQETHSV